jgi:hypothetical protein
MTTMQSLSFPIETKGSQQKLPTTGMGFQVIAHALGSLRIGLDKLRSL